MKSGDEQRLTWSQVPLGSSADPRGYINARNTPFPEQQSMITTVWDVTKEKQLEDRLIQSRKLELVGRLTGGIVHDFNNKLQVITGQIDTVKEVVPQRSREELQEAQEAASQAAALVKQLLAFSRTQKIKPKKIHLNKTISQMIPIIRRIAGPDAQLQWHPGPEVREVLMDPVQLDQVITNLCINSRDALPEEGGVITIATELYQADPVRRQEHPCFSRGTCTVITVTDTGSGMDAETAAHIFEPYFSTRESSGGTGLGLATVYGIIKQHGGVIEVTSAPLEGARFTIYLPPVIPGP